MPDLPKLLQMAEVLPGGQQRRCLLARALMCSPSVLLLDEPTTGVDTDGQRQFCSVLRKLSAEGITIVLVSHDIPLISQYAKRIACIAVTLHWHGPAGELDQHTVGDAYRCELKQYGVAAEQLVTDRPHRHESSFVQ